MATTAAMEWRHGPCILDSANVDAKNLSKDTIESSKHTEFTISKSVKMGFQHERKGKTNHLPFVIVAPLP